MLILGLIIVLWVETANRLLACFYHAFKWSTVSPMLHVYQWGRRVYGAEHVPPGTVAGGEQSCQLLWPANSFFSYRATCGVHGKVRAVSHPILKQAIHGAYPVSRGAADRSALFSAQVSRRWVGYRCFLARHLHTRWTDHRPQWVQRWLLRRRKHHCYL